MGLKDKDLKMAMTMLRNSWEMTVLMSEQVGTQRIENCRRVKWVFLQQKTHMAGGLGNLKTVNRNRSPRKLKTKTRGANGLSDFERTRSSYMRPELKNGTRTVPEGVVANYFLNLWKTSTYKENEG